MIEVLPLGAGQDVGRSCILVKINNKRIMFDCGMHMGYHDERRFPDFALCTGIDLVVISHFHLDHCGALPYYTGIVGYEGPIVMTAPTKTICPLLLEDYRKIVVERRGEMVTPGAFFTSAMIDSMINKQVVVADLHQKLTIDDIVIEPIYAGHVLGAAMFLVTVGLQSCLYTGDYNMTPDRHLGAARLPVELDIPSSLDLLITETTYATTVRESKRARERDFLRSVHTCVAAGGKVLIPTFALGRAQELCLLIDTYWSRMGLSEQVPVFFSAGLAERATDYYGMHLDWTNEAILKKLPHNPFEFKNVRVFEKHYVEQPGPMVLFSTPGMLHSGQSLNIFAKWAGDERNLLIMPGYCVAGTVGAKVLSGSKRVEVDLGSGPSIIDVRLQIKNLSFSAHADAKGILQLIKHCHPDNVLLVHGEKSKMWILKTQVEKEFNVPCYDPANGHYVYIAPKVEKYVLKESVGSLCSERSLEVESAARVVAELHTCELLSEDEKLQLQMQSVQAHSLQKTPLVGILSQKQDNVYTLQSVATRSGLDICFSISHATARKADPRKVQVGLIRAFHPEIAVYYADGRISARSLVLEFADDKVTVTWSIIDDTLGKYALSLLKEYN